MNILAGIALILVGLVLFSMDKKIKKLQQKIESNKEYIKDLYHIDDERLLHKETD